MEEKIRESLEKGEELLWIGSPEQFDTMDKSNGGSIRLGSIIKAVVTVALIVLYVLAAKKNGADIMPVLIVLLVACGGYAIANPFLTADKLRKKTGYAVTDRRLITVTSEVKGIPYELIKEAAVKTDADGHSTLLCGADAVKAKAGQWRGMGAYPPRLNSETGDCDILVFYAVPEMEKVKELAGQYIAL